MYSLNSFEVNSERIKNNVKNFKKYIGKTKICAIIKADAYGHGIEAVCNAVKDEVDYFGVADLNEAIVARNITQKPILILEPVPYNAIDDCIKNNISLSVSNIKYLSKINSRANFLNKKAKIHLAVNSGMNRLGFSNIEQFKNIVKYIKNTSNLVLESIYTHFFNASDISKTEKQYKIFCKFCNIIKDNKIIKHASASDVSLLNKKYHFDMVRLGILMYGYSEIKPPFIIQPSITLESTIVNIIYVKKGQNVGYGNNFIADKNMKVACIGIGYADGILRGNSNNGHVIIMNKYAKIIGNICMNLFMVDVTKIKCKIGDKVIILGEKNGLQITAKDIADRTKTIPYEILTNIKRNRMEYKVNLTTN